MSQLGVQTPPGIALCGAMAAGKEQHGRLFSRHLHDLHGSRARRDDACLSHESSLEASDRAIGDWSPISRNGLTRPPGMIRGPVSR